VQIEYIEHWHNLISLKSGAHQPPEIFGRGDISLFTCINFINSNVRNPIEYQSDLGRVGEDAIALPQE
jgi:hypothetical protein